MRCSAPSSSSNRGLALGAAFGAGAAAQETTVERDVIDARIAEHGDDFDYLLGDWEFTASDQQYGTYGGRWSAVRLAEGHILDEYRVLGDEGEVYVAITTVRSYNAVLDRWELIGMGDGGALRHGELGRQRELSLERADDQQTHRMAPDVTSSGPAAATAAGPCSAASPADVGSPGGRLSWRPRLLLLLRMGSCCPYPAAARLSGSRPMFTTLPLR